MSVAKTCTRCRVSRVSMCSRRSIASEYASSPVEHPADQTRTEAPSSLPSKMAGITCSARAAKASRSRKKLVTPMRRSWKRSAISFGSVLRCSAYASSVARPREAIRRSIRRPMVLGL
jgi:hypothetical protein